MIMKKNKYVIMLCIVLIMFLSFTAYAHPGRTDEDGGHYNRSDGTYHYHHGYPEHQHINGECPYNFNDITNHNSVGISTTRSSASASTVIEIEKESNGDGILKLLGFMFFGGVLATYSSGFFADPQKDNISENRKKIGEMLFNVGNIMIWASIIILFVSAAVSN